MGKIVIIIERGSVQDVLVKGIAAKTEVTVIDNDTQNPDEQEFNDGQRKLIDENYKKIY